MMEGSEGVRLDIIFSASVTLGSVLHSTLDGVFIQILVFTEAAVSLVAVADELADKHSDLLASWYHLPVPVANATLRLFSHFLPSSPAARAIFIHADELTIFQLLTHGNKVAAFPALTTIRPFGSGVPRTAVAGWALKLTHTFGLLSHWNQLSVPTALETLRACIGQVKPRPPVTFFASKLTTFYLSRHCLLQGTEQSLVFIPASLSQVPGVSQ